MNNPFRAAQNPQATRPQHDSALAGAVAVAVADVAKLLRRVPVKTRPLLKRKTRPRLRPLNPPPLLLQPQREQPSRNPRAQNVPNNALCFVPNAPPANHNLSPNHSRRAARPSRFARSSNASSV